MNISYNLLLSSCIHADGPVTLSSYYGTSESDGFTYFGCSGSETRLIECTVGYAYCGQGQQVGVWCVGMFTPFVPVTCQLASFSS